MIKFQAGCITSLGVETFSVGVLRRAAVEEGANADMEQRSHSAIRTRQSATESNSFFNVCLCRYSAAAWDRGALRINRCRRPALVF